MKPPTEDNFCVWPRARSRCRGRVADREGANLPNATGAHHRWLCSCWRRRPLHALDGSVAVGTARSAIYRREPARRWRPGRRQSGAGRLHPSAVEYGEHDQRDTLRKDLTSISSATSHQLPASCACRMSSSCTHRFRPKLFQSSSLCQSQSGKLAWASPGIGTAGHVCGELFKMMTGLNMVHVPYRGGGAAMADLLSGQLQAYVGAMTSSLAYVKAGSLRVLAVTTATRSEALPDISTVSDFVPGFETSDWRVEAGRRAPPPTSSTG